MLPGGGYDPEGVFPNPVFDYKAAIRFLRANAQMYKLDEGRFALCGGSAGGYHAVMAAASSESDVLYDAALGYSDVSGEVHAVVSWFGVGDLTLQSEFTANSPPMQLPDGTTQVMANFADIFLGVNAREYRNLAHFASPSAWITKDMPPSLVQAGAADMIVPVECSREIVARIRAVCGEERVVYDEFADYAHGDPRFSNEENIAYMISWLKQKLG